MSNLIGCKEEEKPVAMVEKPKPPAPTRILQKPKTSPEYISAITERDGTWTIKLNKSATYAIKSKSIKVRINIGYMIYEVEQMTYGNVIEFTPEWHPGGRVTAGLWNPRAGPGKAGKYLSSVFVKNVKEKLPVIKDEIKLDVKTEPEVKSVLSPSSSEIALEEAIKRLHDQGASQGVVIQIQSEVPKIFEDASKSVDKLREIWK
jgi:hypothetical protein